jgi:small glutamine-rich tetratricopeptide repeat-containing protein alpha
LGDYKAAADAFSKGVELDPSNENLKSGLKNAMARLPAEDNDDDGPPPLMPEDQINSSSPNPAASGGLPNLAGMADMMRGMGGGGAGGMPDLASMMNNPMMMQMAQQMMANGGLERLMSNPSVANMVHSLTSVFCFWMSDAFHLLSDESCPGQWIDALDGGNHVRSQFEESVRPFQTVIETLLIKA